MQGQQPVALRHISSMRLGWSLSALQSTPDAQGGPPRPSASLAADLIASSSIASSTYCRLHPPSQSSDSSASQGQPFSACI